MESIDVLGYLEKKKERNEIDYKMHLNIFKKLCNLNILYIMVLERFMSFFLR